MFELFPFACHGCLFIALHAMSVISCQFFSNEKFWRLATRSHLEWQSLLQTWPFQRYHSNKTLKKKRDSAIKSLRKWTLKNGNLNRLQMV